jgi:serine/threonine protein kinase
VTPRLLMGYAAGGDLSQYKDFTKSETRTMFKQQLKAIAYLHSKGISHRDVKLKNILVQHRYLVVFTLFADFGLSTSWNVLRTHCGTLLYLAPKVTKKRTKYTKSADIWSISTVGLKYAFSFPEALPE